MLILKATKPVNCVNEEVTGQHNTIQHRKNRNWNIDGVNLTRLTLCNTGKYKKNTIAKVMDIENIKCIIIIKSAL